MQERNNAVPGFIFVGARTAPDVPVQFLMLSRNANRGKMLNFVH